MRCAVLGISLLAVSAPTWADGVPALDDQLAAALKTQDYAAVETDVGKLLMLKPSYPRYEFELAVARAHLGNTAGSLAALDTLADLGVLIDTDAEPAFAPLKGAAGWPALVAKFADLHEPVGRAEPAFRLEEPDFIPEGIAHDPESGDFFVASVHLRKIMRVHAGKESLFADRRAGLWSVLGIAADPARGALWATTDALPEMQDYDPSLKDKSALLRFNLRSGKLEARYAVPDGAAHAFGDLGMGPDGTVYVSDAYGGVYVLAPGAAALEPLTPPGALRSAQGVAVSPDGKRLYVADYPGGLFAYSFTDHSLTRLAPVDGIYLYYVDGLAFHGRDLVATQNGAEPQRLVRFRLDESGLKVWGAQVLLASDPLAPEPTLFTLVGDELYLVANAQWSRFDEKGDLPPKDQLQNPLILKVALH